ncbi:hypothetical protein HAX54_005504, partial [Datura stramonium]|nr:hypothetical protein [Datura stramonium]
SDQNPRGDQTLQDNQSSRSESQRNPPCAISENSAESYARKREQPNFEDETMKKPIPPLETRTTVETPDSVLKNSSTRGLLGNSKTRSLENGVVNRSRELHRTKGCQRGGILPTILKTSALPIPVPKKLKMSNLSKYNRTSNPYYHITTYTTRIKGNDLSESEMEFVLVKKFGETATKGVVG